MTRIDTLSNLDLPQLPSLPSKVLDVPAQSPAGGVHVALGDASGMIGSYTLVYDLHVNSTQSGKYLALLQTDPANSNDGDLFINRGSDTGTTYGIGISSDYPGMIAMDTWTRLAFVIEDIGGGTVRIHRYVDGVALTPIDKEASRYAIDAAQGFLIFADEDGETLDAQLSSFAFVPRALTGDEVAGLGGADAGGILGTIDGVEFDFQNGGLEAAGGNGTLTWRDEAQAGTVVDAEAADLPALPSDPSVLAFDATDATGGFLVDAGLTADSTSYTLVYDILVGTDQAGFGGLFQIDTTNGSDGELFLRGDGESGFGIGISSQYEGSVTAGAWARLAFTITDLGDGTSRLLKFIDGVQVGEQVVDTERFTVSADNGFIILGDDDGETFSGALANFAFVNTALDTAAIAALGGAQAGPVFGGPVGRVETVVYDFSGGIGNGRIEPVVGEGNMFDRSVDPTLGLDPDLALNVQPVDASGGYVLDAALDTDLTSFTLVYDLQVPAGQDVGYGALLQLDAGNASDGELFLKDLGDGTYGIGISSQYDGALVAGEWARVAVTLTDLGDGASRLDKFVDGALVGTQTVETARFTLTAEGGALLFADNDGETFAASVAAVSLLDRAATADEIAELGGPAMGGAFGTTIAGSKVFEFDFIGGSDIENGQANATVGNAVLIERGFETVAVTKDINHYLLKSGDSLEIDVTEHFSGANLTFSATSSDGTPLAVTLTEEGLLQIEAQALGFADITVTATDDLGNAASDNFRVRVVGENAYAFAVLPDTQNYDGADGHILYRMTEFLAANKDTMNLQIVTHVGDVTGSNTDAQWQRVSDAYATLEAAGLPYTLLPGNHDQAAGGSASDHSTLMNSYFDPDRYFADMEGRDHGVYDGEATNTANNFKTFTAPDGTDWVVLSLEFGPRDDVMRWADDVLTTYSDHRAIVLTHHYTNMGDIAGPDSGPLYAEGTGKNYGMQTTTEGVNDARDMWSEVLSKHGNLSFVFSGHVFGDGAETIVNQGEQGNTVYQMFVNYQNGVAQIMQTAGNPGLEGDGGNGAMRLVIIDPENGQMHTETYYANLDTFMTASRGDETPSRGGAGSVIVEEQVVQPVTFGSTADLGVPVIDGDDGTSGAIQLPQFNSQNGLWVQPGFDPASGGDYFEAATLVYDMFIPADIGLVSILQTDLNNMADGSMWIQQGAGGGLIGTNGQDDGPFPLGGWSRVVLSLSRNEADGQYQLDKYVNGALMGTQVFGSVEGILHKSGFLLFADDSGETPQDWVLSSFAMVEKALSADEVAALGGVTAEGPFQTAPEGVNAVQFDFEDGDFGASFGPGSMTQEWGGGDALSLTGLYREHQETFDDINLGTVDSQSRAVAGQDVKVDLATTDHIVLDGTASVDPAAQIARARWLNSAGEVVATGLVAEVAVSGGVERYTLELTDSEGHISRDSMLVVGVDGQTLMFDNFNDGTMDGWAAQSGGWQVSGAVHSGTGTEAGYLRSLPGASGLVLWADEAAAEWSDYTVSASIENEGAAPMGLVAAANGEGDMYRLEMAVGNHAIRLVKIAGGETTVLAETRDVPPYDQVARVELSVNGGTLMAAIDGKVLFGGAVTDSDPLAGGTVGFFHDGTSPLARIDDVSVRSGNTIEAREEVTPEGEVLLSEDFGAGADRWTMVDEGELGQAAAWSVLDGQLVQSEDRYSRQLMGRGDTAPDAYWGLDWSPLGDGYHVLRKGTYALLNNEAAQDWTDYSVEMDFTAPSGGAVGLLFRYVDDQNYYKLELDREGGTSQLVAVVDGIDQIYWQGVPSYDTTGANHLRLDVKGGTITVWLDGMRLFDPVTVSDHDQGSVALYNWGAPDTRYDNVTVTSLIEEEMVTLTGTEGADVMPGTVAAEKMLGLQGADALAGRGGDDHLFGGAGRDSLHGGAGEDFISGGLNADVMTGGRGADMLYGRQGDDVFNGGGDAGNDRFVGGLGNDLLRYYTAKAGVMVDLAAGRAQAIGEGDAAGIGIDLVVGIERVAGSAHDDVLIGDDKANTLNGRAGADTLTGGAGADTFVFRKALWQGSDVVTDFVSGVDVLNFSSADADRSHADLQSFVFGDDQPLANGLWVETAGEDVLVKGDFTGDAAADFSIRLAGVATVTAADFLL